MPKAIPEGYDTVTPYLIVADGNEALELYAKAFGASEHLKLAGPDGQSVAHAEMKIGDSIVMLSGSSPDMDVAKVGDEQWPPISLMIYLEDVDVVHKRAVAAGMVSESEPTDMFYGDRAAKLRDPWGHRWTVATHIEDVTQEEVQRRADKMFGG